MKRRREEGKIKNERKEKDKEGVMVDLQDVAAVLLLVQLHIQVLLLPVAAAHLTRNCMQR
jgi:hypothetical protein